MTLFCDQIINQNSDISLGTVNDDPFLALQLSRRINPRYKPLRCCLLIPGASFLLSPGLSVKLPAAEQPFDIFKLQCTL